jgi:hypothetical protein
MKKTIGIGIALMSLMVFAALAFPFGEREDAEAHREAIPIPIVFFMI